MKNRDLEKRFQLAVEDITYGYNEEIDTKNIRALIKKESELYKEYNLPPLEDNVKCLRQLLEETPELVNMIDQNKRSLLKIAALQVKNCGIVPIDLLMAKGANPNFSPGGIMTPKEVIQEIKDLNLQSMCLTAMEQRATAPAREEITGQDTTWQDRVAANRALGNNNRAKDENIRIREKYYYKLESVGMSVF
jgi:hypothetical protein